MDSRRRPRWLRRSCFRRSFRSWPSGPRLRPPGVPGRVAWVGVPWTARGLWNVPVLAVSGARASRQVEGFDLESDPLEMNNLYGEPGNELLVKELKAELKRLQILYEDPILERYPL